MSKSEYLKDLFIPFNGAGAGVRSWERMGLDGFRMMIVNGVFTKVGTEWRRQHNFPTSNFVSIRVDDQDPIRVTQGLKLNVGSNRYFQVVVNSLVPATTYYLSVTLVKEPAEYHGITAQEDDPKDIATVLPLTMRLNNAALPLVPNTPVQGNLNFSGTGLVAGAGQVLVNVPNDFYIHHFSFANRGGASVAIAMYDSGVLIYPAEVPVNNCKHEFIPIPIPTSGLITLDIVGATTGFDWAIQGFRN